MKKKHPICSPRSNTTTQAAAASKYEVADFHSEDDPVEAPPAVCPELTLVQLANENLGELGESQQMSCDENESQPSAQSAQTGNNVNEDGSVSLFDEECNDLIVMRTKAYRRKGHLVTIILLMIFFGLGLISAISLNNSESACANFRFGFLLALAFDIFVIQPAVMGFTVLFRWMTVDDAFNREGLLWRGLHPFDGQLIFQEM